MVARLRDDAGFRVSIHGVARYAPAESEAQGFLRVDRVDGGLQAEPARGILHFGEHPVPGIAGEENHPVSGGVRFCQSGAPILRAFSTRVELEVEVSGNRGAQDDVVITRGELGER